MVQEQYLTSCYEDNICYMSAQIPTKNSMISLYSGTRRL